MIHSAKILWMIIATVAFAIEPRALAANDTSDAAAKKVESVLDKLEKRLIDREGSPLTDEEDLSRATLKPAKGKAPTATYNAKNPAQIKGQTPSGKNLKEVQLKINDYDNKIEALESDLRKLRAGIYEGSATDNQIMLDVRTAKDSKFIIRTLATRLDGNTLFNQTDPAGLWMPSKEIPMFFGPLQPGEHRIDITATIAPLTIDGLELPTWKHKSIQQSFSFTVGDGKIRKEISIEIEAPKNDGAQPTAKLTEEERK
jgi:hypothetical protein